MLYNIVNVRLPERLYQGNEGPGRVVRSGDMYYGIYFVRVEQAGSS